MAERTLTMFVGRLRGLLTRPGDSADAELLGRFVATRDETAFAELVRRHGGMVFGVCRRVLNDGDAAEDAFQATFLVLAQKAEALGRGTVLAVWLYGVAFRTALKARTAEARRRHYERVAGAEALRSPGRGVEHSAPATQTEAMWRELRPILDQELARLPARYREPVVLCFLEGQTHEAAARQLGWPKGTVAGRLSRARAILRDRLTRRGVTLTAVGLTTVLSSQAASAALPAALISTTIEAAISGTVSATVAGLAKGVMHGMFVTRLQFTAALALSVAALGGWTVVWAWPITAAEPATAKQTAAQEKPSKADAADDHKRIQGTWHVISGEREGKVVEEDGTRSPTFTFKGDKLLIGEAGGREAKFKLDPSKNPKVIELTPADGPEKDKTIRGLYAFEGAKLKLCIDNRDGKDAKEFATKPGEGFVLLILERKSPRERNNADNAQVDEAKARTLTAKALHDIGIAFHNYHNDHGHLPPAAVCDANGKPLLSWRVLLLPYLMQDNLARQFHMDEPWDSAHNKQWLAQMPKVFAPLADKPEEPFTTYYRVFHGNGAAFEGTKGLPFAQFKNGLDCTVLVVEAGEAVPWTKPDELLFDPAKPLPKLGGHFSNGFHLLMADGSKFLTPNTFDEKVLRALITRSDGKGVGVGDLKK